MLVPVIIITASAMQAVGRCTGGTTGDIRLPPRYVFSAVAWRDGEDGRNGLEAGEGVAVARRGDAVMMVVVAVATMTVRGGGGDGGYGGGGGEGEGG